MSKAETDNILSKYLWELYTFSQLGLYNKMRHLFSASKHFVYQLQLSLNGCSFPQPGLLALMGNILQLWFWRKQHPLGISLQQWWKSWSGRWKKSVGLLRYGLSSCSSLVNYIESLHLGPSYSDHAKYIHLASEKTQVICRKCPVWLLTDIS